MTRTLDQQRAAFAWESATAGMQRYPKEYKALAKGAPALIMTSGLMPTLAFYDGKGRPRRCSSTTSAPGSMHRLPTVWSTAGPDVFAVHGGPPGCRFATFLRATDEALEILKWIRQFVDAV